MTIQGSIIAVLSLLALSSSGAYARDHPRDIAALIPRDNVDECQAILFILKATAFCSTFIGLRDVTRTTTGAGSLATAFVTVAGAPCTVTAARETITSVTTVSVAGPTITATSILVAQTLTSTIEGPTPTVLSTTSVDANPITTTQVIPTVVTVTSTFVTTTTPVAAKRGMVRASTSTTKSSNPATKAACTIKGLPPKVTNFVCEVVSQACSKYVRPKTTTTTAPGLTRVTTAVKTASPICQTATPSPSINVQTMIATLPAITVTETSTPPATISTITVTPQEVTSVVTITNPPQIVTASSTSTSTQTVTTTLSVPNSQCTPGVRAGGGLFGQNYESFCGSRCRPADTVGTGPVDTSSQSNFPACIRFCDDNLGGQAIYNKVTQNCECNFFVGSVTEDPAYDCALAQR